ncbi:proline-rich protein 23A3-like [Mus pahari]|uniref:proline-rich protein 23A3-like n=1 Tax=Mus pahari TaxID=10093 RepID=UPI000A311CB2|nr:proline-rich protein 23A3-like [Mus pahari]
MLHTRPRSPSANPVLCWSAQTPAPSPAKRRRLHQEPACLEALVQPELEATAEPATSVVFLAAGSALQLPLDGIDLLLEPEPNSVLEVSLQEHTILLVPEGLMTEPQPGQPEFMTISPQGPAAQDGPQDHLVGLQEETCEYFYQEDVCDKDADLDFLEPWARPPYDQASGSFSSIPGVPSPLSQDQVPEPSTGAERYSPKSIWELDSYLLGPFPDSPLQPLPSSPSLSPQEQLPPRPPRSPRAPCKARKRLVYE